MKRQREEAERREKTYLAFCDAAVNAYLAQKEATS